MIFAKNNEKASENVAIIQLFINMLERTVEISDEDLEDDNDLGEVVMSIYESVSHLLRLVISSSVLFFYHKRKCRRLKAS